MKTLTIFFTALVLSFSTISANAQITATNSAPQIYQKIMDNVRVPENMKSTVSSERVCVTFTIDENGRAHVIDVAAGRTDLRKPVTSQFEAIDFSGLTDTNGQTYSIWLNFKVV